MTSCVCVRFWRYHWPRFVITLFREQALKKCRFTQWAMRTHTNPSDLLADTQNRERLFTLCHSRFKPLHQQTTGYPVRDNGQQPATCDSSKRDLITTDNTTPGAHQPIRDITSSTVAETSRLVHPRGIIPAGFRVIWRTPVSARKTVYVLWLNRTHADSLYKWKIAPRRRWSASFG